MAKTKPLPILIGIAILCTLIATSLWFYYHHHPTALGRRLHKAKLKMIKEVTKNPPECRSQYDCKMEVMPTQECIPVDWIISYSKRNNDVASMIESINEYKTLYRQIYGNNINKQCARANNPKSRCLKGRCVVRIYQGQILKY